MSEAILSPNNNVAEVAEPLDPQIAEERRLKAVAAVEAKQADLDVRIAAESKLHWDLKELAREEDRLLYNIGCEISDHAGEETDTIERAIESLNTIRGRKSIKAKALRINTEEKKPSAQIALLRAKSALKMAAADKIDADRWARLRGYSAALDALAASEGDVIVKPERFEAEAEVGDELRREGVLMWKWADELEAQLRANRGEV